ncbi:sodium/solute symporter [Termitidicoccus mucosus]|uniref:Sodium transporter n=1 Tax=Termitidicoccus mucosus TaxID=1184151 RepID=A0A178IDN6_9BACT|nr:sodium transporter [Opitutaceae bacterium TSB47]
MNLAAADIAVILAYFAGTLALGLWISRRNRDSERYFLGGRNFPGWIIGISFIGAMISSVTFIALPADSFKTAWLRFLPNLAFPVVVLISAYVFIPFFRRGTVTSAYQYLALRFGPSISAYGAAVFLVAQIVRTATIVYLVAVLMSAMIGLGIPQCILIAGGVTAIYTIKGGFEAVIWTDVIQTLILVTGSVVILSLIIYNIPGGLGQLITEASASGKLSLRDLNPATGLLDPTGAGFSLSEKTATMLILVGFTQYLAGKLNQESVQRWCSSRSAREARKSMLVLGLASLPIWAIFMFIGTGLWVYYRHFPDPVAAEILAGTQKAELILPHFIVTVMPVGLVGLVISSALAAAMSALSSAINSASMVMVNDIYRAHMAKGRGESHYLRAGRLASLLVSLVMIAGAYLFHISDAKTLTDLNIVVTAIVGGGISGAFLLGMLTRRGDARAVLTGIAVTLAFSLYALLMQFNILPRAFDPYYTSILGNIIMIVVGYAAAWIFPARSRDLTNLTVWDQSGTPLK